jgi:hypothetical protein
VVKAEIDQPPDLVTASVTIKACKNGYAQVFAVPTQPDRYQAEQLFLKDDGGTWIVVGSGTGIDCDDPEGIDAATQAACAALRCRAAKSSGGRTRTPNNWARTSRVADYTTPER